MEEIVKDAYGWLARTYQEGDQIYLFGKFNSLSWLPQPLIVVKVSLEVHIKCGCLRE